MRNLKLALSGLLTMTAVAQAIPLLEGEIETGYIQQNPSGWVQYKGTRVDVDHDLALDDDNGHFFRGKLELPLPLLPNLYASYEKMEFGGRNRLTRTIQVENKVYPVNDTVSTDVKLNRYDVGIYYNIPMVNTLTAGILDLEVGAVVRFLDFSYKVRSENTGITSSKSDTLPVPLLYGNANVNIPGVDFLNFNLELKGIKYRNSSYYEVSGEIRLVPIKTIAVDPFIAIGYKYEKLELHDIEDIYSDVEIKQPYISIGVMF